MDVERIRISLAEDIYADIGRLTEEEIAEEFKNRLQQYFGLVKEVVESDFNNLTDEELFKLLSKVYDISLYEDDYLKMLSILNDRRYTFIHRIPTTMTFIDVATERHGRSFDWWDQLYQVYYLAATSNDFKFDYSKIYSKEEIKKLVADKDIVLLIQEVDAIDDSMDFIAEEYEPLDVDIKEYGDNNISQFVLDNYNLLGQLLRKKFTKKTVLKDMRRMIEDISKELDEVFSDILFSNNKSL